MASQQPNERVARLEKYVEGLKQRMSSPIPPKHDKSDGSRASFKQMLENDLKKTQATINKLKGV